MPRGCGSRTTSGSPCRPSARRRSPSCWRTGSAPTRRSRISGSAFARAPAGTRFSSKRWCRRWWRPGASPARRGRIGYSARLPSSPSRRRCRRSSRRADRLRAREKEVLGTAAVIGREVLGPVLHRVAALPEAELAAAVAELVRREFLYETALYPEAEYAFKHPLTQEVAYRTQLAERRRAVHAAVARAIEGFHADRLDEHAALLAQHWEGADEVLVAAEWHRRAAEWVGARDRAEMSRHWQRVRALLDAVPESVETRGMGVLARTHLLQNGMGLGQADDEAAALFAEGMALASRLDGPAPRIVLLSTY